MAEILTFPHTVHMAKKAKKARKGGPGHFIREWRDHRDLTLERLAERIGLTHSTLSRIERGKTAYTQPVLEALAEALGTTPASLIMRDPSKPGAVWDLWEAIPASERPHAERVLETFTKKAS